MRLPPGTRFLLLLALAPFLGACQGEAGSWVGDTDLADTRPTRADRPAAWRRVGPRLPAFSGRTPEARGWVQVDDLLWIDRSDADAYGRGLVSDGQSYVPRVRALPPNVPAREGFVLRTNHVSLQTNVAWDDAVAVAREAEGHVQRLIGTFGEALDLRMPDGPLRVLVMATRTEFQSTLRGLVHGHVSWGAFYDARSGIVYMSLEAAPSGALPWQADLRHEMTHQILDLSRGPSRRGGAFRAPWFWLWEGFAIWTETLGDPPGVDRGAARLTRFRRRNAWGEAVSLQELFHLTQRGFEGRHYDQTASLMRYLMDPEAPTRRMATLDVLARLLRGPLSESALTRALGTDVAGLEAAWRKTVDR